MGLFVRAGHDPSQSPASRRWKRERAQVASGKIVFTIRAATFALLAISRLFPRRQENRMDWLRKHMRDHVASPASVDDSGENISSFPDAAAAPSRDDTSAALDLVSQAAEVIRGI